MRSSARRKLVSFFFDSFDFSNDFFFVATSPNSSNPFAAALPPPSNPFNLGKPSPPSMNQLRAQSSTLGGPLAIMAAPSNPQQPLSSSYSNASALSSLFSSPAPSTSPLTVMGSQQHPTTLSLGGQQRPTSPWGSSGLNQVGSSSFPVTSPSANNPFAMWFAFYFITLFLRLHFLFFSFCLTFLFSFLLLFLEGRRVHYIIIAMISTFSY